MLSAVSFCAVRVGAAAHAFVQAFIVLVVFVQITRKLAESNKKAAVLIVDSQCKESILILMYGLMELGVAAQNKGFEMKTNKLVSSSSVIQS